MQRKACFFIVLFFFVMTIIPVQADAVQVEGRVIGSDEEPLKEVGFTLYLYGEPVNRNIISDDQGYIRFEIQEPGIYQLRQTSKITGYLPIYTASDIVADFEQTKIVIKDIVNQKVLSNVTFYFMDDAGNPISHLRADLCNEKGEVIRKLESDRFGKVEEEELAIGTYSISQQNYKEQYEQKESMQFRITDQNYDKGYEMQFVFSSLDEKLQYKNDPTLIIIFLLLMSGAVGGILFYAKKHGHILS